MIWRDKSNDINAYDRYKRYLNQKCKLNWITESHNTCMTFLDVTITLEMSKGKCTTRTYQKVEQACSF